MQSEGFGTIHMRLGDGLELKDGMESPTLASDVESAGEEVKANPHAA